MRRTVKRSIVGVCTGFIALALAFGAWTAMHANACDPKNMHYVLWKWGIAAMNLDDATCAITEDVSGKQELIIGKSRQEISRRFGYVLTPQEAGQVLKQCIPGSWAEGKNPVFIRRSNLVVTFNHDVADHVGLLKPC